MQVNISHEVFQALSDLARKYQFRNRDEICCYGITVSQCYALQVLSRRETMTGSELSSNLALDLSSTTRLVDSLVRKKLVIRRRATLDARVREIKITDSGRRMVQRIEEEFAKVVATALMEFPLEVQNAIPQVLRRLSSVIHACDTPARLISPQTIMKV